ncbi:unnamed protein product [Adineta steineri]|uniref:Opioid growth factor receptor (OGFr) conserved domain-containing protein n=1 Tax=Adineta steineri TaxID=433720 RepID=A0A815J2V2_9BILA|nr:unnamed protein product [Adineta steineri]
MAMANNKTLCFTCNKEKITYACEGCSKRFCLIHLTEHQQILNEELNHIINDYDQFKQRINEQKQNPQNHSLIKQINQWETNSIEIIQQKAQECITNVIKSSQIFINDIEMKFNNLSDQIKQIHKENEFNEINLIYLRNQLIKITQELNNPSNMSIRKNSQSFINDISIILLKNKKSIQKTGQSQLQQPSSYDRIDSDEDSHNQRSKKSNMISDNDDDDNYKQRRFDPVTRSSATLSKLRINFDDSDDENEDSRHYSYSKRDIAEYRNHYPNARSNKNINDNYDFYTNQIRSHPDGDFIDNIHKNWFGDHRKLEYHHGYIEWLFPLQEKGLNISAEPLQKHEIESISKDKEALDRLLESYKLMLDFYGFKLVDVNIGEIRRLSGDAYKSRFHNLNSASHNYLRITRILKCLGEFKYEHLKFPFLAAILRESITENTLSNCVRSCKDSWIETLRSPEERRAIRQYARELVEYRNKGMTPPKSHKAIRP